MDTTLFDSKLIGTTYTQKELVTYLYLENLYLKSKNPTMIAPSPFTVVDRRIVGTAQEYDLVRTYSSMKPPESDKKRHLILANEYPNVGSEYGNGFVHRRANLYRSYGADVDILAFGKRKIRDIYHYEGSTVLSGYVNELVGLLSTRQHDSISVHFLNQEMWNCLFPFLEDNRIFIFLHGYESRRWIRQAYDHKSAKDLNNSIARTLHLQSFWQEVLRHQSKIEKFIFVSNWWKSAVFEDMEIGIPARKSEIIHNFIDTDLFNYVKKNAEQRFNILWVRSASARNYGNDLAIKCITHLLNSIHGDKFNIKIVGDGKYFDEFEESLSNYPNVEINRGFLSHDEIARLHKRFGIFLVPTRLDSQGVSRDEAMSSGLVPVTNAVAAVPEFVDDTCALVAPAEDSRAMANLILKLVDDPEEYLALSHAASQRVRTQSSETETVQREAQLMGIYPNDQESF